MAVQEQPQHQGFGFKNSRIQSALTAQSYSSTVDRLLALHIAELAHSLVTRDFLGLIPKSRTRKKSCVPLLLGWHQILFVSWAIRAGAQGFLLLSFCAQELFLVGWAQWRIWDTWDRTWVGHGCRANALLTTVLSVQPQLPKLKEK